MIMKCKSCGCDNPDPAKFCINCGKRLEAEVTCPKCGCKNKGAAKFCNECGYQLIQDTDTLKASMSENTKETNNKNSARKCPNCGFEVGENDICDSCGYDVTKEKYVLSDLVDNEKSNVILSAVDEMEKEKKKHQRSKNLAYAVIAAVAMVVLISAYNILIHNLSDSSNNVSQNTTTNNSTQSISKPTATPMRTPAPTPAPTVDPVVAQRMAEEKAAAEAKSYETGITYDQLARTPNNYKGQKVKFSGEVVQVIEGTVETQLRLAVNGDYDCILFCRVPKAKTTDMRILEDDYITIMGVSNGLITYESTLGGHITIPDVSVADWGPN